MTSSYTVLQGGMAGTPRFGQAMGQINTSDIQEELAHRGYTVAPQVVPIHHAPVAAQVTRSIAIKVAVDEAIVQAGWTRTTTHLYRCPSGMRCNMDRGVWNSVITWCVDVANGYLNGTYTLPSWAKYMMHMGSLRGVALSGVSGLSGFADWLQENPWFVQSVGDTITNYGEYLTAKNVEDAIKANTEKALTKDDALALVSALQQGGYVPQGKGGTVAQGASMAAGPSWMIPLMIGGAVLVVVMLMKK